MPFKSGALFVAHFTYTYSRAPDLQQIEQWFGNVWMKCEGVIYFGEFNVCQIFVQVSRFLLVNIYDLIPRTPRRIIKET